MHIFLRFLRTNPARCGKQLYVPVAHALVVPFLVLLFAGEGSLGVRVSFLDLPGVFVFTATNPASNTKGISSTNQPCLYVLTPVRTCSAFFIGLVFMGTFLQTGVRDLPCCGTGDGVVVTGRGGCVLFVFIQQPGQGLSDGAGVRILFVDTGSC